MRHHEQRTPTSLEERVRRLEDRNAISERTIKYAAAIDAADWDAYGACFTDQIYVDFSDGGMPAKLWDRSEFVDFSRRGLSGFEARQHLSPNHVIEFVENDPDRAICYSYMYAQHHLPNAPGGDFFLMRGAYTGEMVRTELGWLIERLVQKITWIEGNQKAPAEAAKRFEMNRSQSDLG